MVVIETLQEWLILSPLARGTRSHHHSFLLTHLCCIRVLTREAARITKNAPVVSGRGV